MRLMWPPVKMSLILLFYGQLIFDKGGRSIKGIKKASSTNGIGRTGLEDTKKMKLDHQLTPCTRIN